MVGGIAPGGSAFFNDFDAVDFGGDGVAVTFELVGTGELFEVVDGGGVAHIRGSDYQGADQDAVFVIFGFEGNGQQLGGELGFITLVSALTFHIGGQRSNDIALAPVFDNGAERVRFDIFPIGQGLETALDGLDAASSVEVLEKPVAAIEGEAVTDSSDVRSVRSRGTVAASAVARVMSCF
ncbi:MAG: hypothetical protein AAF572_28750 [Cyanobacteria bacterium P01_B01_bin.77]